MSAIREYIALRSIIGGSIKRIRRNQHLSQVQLAALCHMQKASMSRIENGKDNATILSLRTIAVALQVELRELFQTV